MRRPAPITTLLVDVGGVLLTNGWDHHARRRAAKNFNLKWAAMEDRQGPSFAVHEEGRITLEEYLDRVIFYQKRSFTRSQFRLFMFAQSKPYTETIEMVCNLKARYGLRIAVVSNESREVNAYRIHKFKLNGFVDSFISSCFVHARKPDVEMFRLALDIAKRHTVRCSTSRTRRCSSRSRKAWEFEAFFTRTTNRPEQNSLHSDSRTTTKRSSRSVRRD